MFETILIANRGEIAVRIIRTCRAMGIKTVAVFSEADSRALHVLEADEAVLLGPPEPRESYLVIPKIIEAAKKTKAQAIHPGYGFLSERATFAQACLDAGITFIGPSPKAIADLGDKLTARQIVTGHGVPVTPGAILSGDDPSIWKAQAEKIGYPVLIKASAGGGGKGMRIVHHPGDFEQACATAASEATAAFGDGRVYLEKYIARPRHIEFQILADQYGHVIHLFERECSIQRRYQKIIEETPSPALDDDLRQRMGKAAVDAARAAGYTNAGTVEFLLDDATKSFYFLEVNTRLQVEHPITEEVTGLDLVQWQIRIAAGQPLTLQQDELRQRGHAFECRIYAEDPQNNFAPCPGTISALSIPAGPGLRHDGGIYAGCDVPIYYDPILAKLVASGPDRETARLRMIEALRRYVLLGIQTPIPYLLEILQHPAFAKAELSTHFLQDHLAGWKAKDTSLEEALIAYLLDEVLPGAVASTQAAQGEAKTSKEPLSPWQTLGAWRLGSR